jgi:hypothetical protein
VPCLEQSLGIAATEAMLPLLADHGFVSAYSHNRGQDELCRFALLKPLADGVEGIAVFGGTMKGQFFSIQPTVGVRHAASCPPIGRRWQLGHGSKSSRARSADPMVARIQAVASRFEQRFGSLS